MLTAGDIVQDVQVELGRKYDTAVVTEARLLRFIGAAQRAIIAAYPTLDGCSKVDKDSFTTVADQNEYDFSSVEGGLGKIISLKYMDSYSARTLSPFPGGAVMLDSRVPDIAEYGSSIPEFYARRDKTIILFPQPQLSDIPLHIWYSIVPADPAADEDLILQDFYLAITQIAAGYALRLEVNEKPQLSGVSELYIEQGMALAAEVASQQDEFDTELSFL